ncbi:MAG: chemotaxis protein CheW [Pseudobdellovibrionaceae bacterium]|nr:chemotaxis protein CheW [Pseudobdellovibrionaceae bacterium]
MNIPGLAPQIMDSEHSMFSIRGDLDGGKDSQDFTAVKQFIGLLLGKEEFLLPIEVTNEIIMMNQLTFVPRAPRFIEGVINLRGTILPAINLRKMMGLPNEEPTLQSRIIVTRYEEVTVGLIVDGITYVISLNEDQLQQQALPSRGNGSELISTISKRGNQVNLFIDFYKFLADFFIYYQAVD